LRSAEIEISAQAKCRFLGIEDPFDGKDAFVGGYLRIQVCRVQGDELKVDLTVLVEVAAYAKIRKLYRTGVSKAEIARRLDIGRTSVRRILKTNVYLVPPYRRIGEVRN
jgi:hypothetical protein